MGLVFYEGFSTVFSGFERLEGFGVCVEIEGLLLALEFSGFKVCGLLFFGFKGRRSAHLGVSENRGPEYSIRSSRILTIRTPK